MPASLRSIFRFQESGLLVVVLVLGAALTAFSGSVRLPVFRYGPDGARQRVFTTDAAGNRAPAFVVRNKFLNPQNLAQLAKDTSFIAIMAVGAAFVIIAGGIDLSVGSLYALSAVMGALVLRHFAAADGPPWPGILLGGAACLGTAMLCGLVNGALITSLKVHPFIITLGAMAILRGIAFVATTGQSIGGFPAEFRGLVRHEVGPGLSLVPLLVTLVVLLAGWICLGRLALGRWIYAVGGNELAARFSGIRVERVKLAVYVFSGLSAGIAALLSLGYYGAATSGDGEGYELNVIAAAVVGGASLLGGRGSALGVVLGALVIQMISSGIIILGIDQNYSQIIIGTVVIAAVVLDNVNTWLARRRTLSP
ncbi:MAG TPA: ABC transporter permease [Opitutaceae bacterium]|jgi:ribose transport system permease protein|nr:ABC transporter permease [Opitutaceae bacterium]